MSKYRAVKTKIGKIVFDSKAEANRYATLKLLERSGRIKELELQPEFELQPSFKKNGKTNRKISYRADFKYYDNNLKKYVIEDVKGVETEVFKIKHKMFDYKYPELELELVKYGRKH